MVCSVMNEDGNYWLHLKGQKPPEIMLIRIKTIQFLRGQLEL
jgi:hypothetical protein